MALPIEISLHNILAFLQYLHENALSPKVIKNYMSSVHSQAQFYGMKCEIRTHEAVARFLRSISINSKFSPTLGACLMSIHCIEFHWHAIICLTQFYIGPFSSQHSMDSSACPTLPLIVPLNLTPTIISPGETLYLAPRGPSGYQMDQILQHHRSHHIVQLPTIQNHFVCPVTALKPLLASRILPPSAPLFANNFSSYRQVIDTHVRDALKKVLSQINIPLRPHGFHTFRRSGATLAFDNNITLQNIIAHWLWRSSAIWTYLQNSSQTPSIIPSTFARVIPTNF